MSKIRDYFTFTRSERNGILVLLLIILVLLISLQIIPYFYNRTQVDYSSFENEIDQFISSVKEKDSSGSNIGNSNNIIISGEYFPFNPNEVSESDLLKMGIPNKVAHAWVNYISKGGKFIDKEDVKKVWGLKDSVYQKLIPFINIPKASKDQNISNSYTQNGKTNYAAWNNKSSFSDKKDNSIELNSADSAGFCALPGIGSGFTKRILKYRDLLGGYIAKEQLLEVFGFTAEMYSKIENLVYVETSSIKKMNLNKCEFKQLIRHPYCTKEIVNKILEYRKIQGKITNIQDLVKDRMLTQEQCNKLVPYIEY
jgi:competence protein ComEA